MSEVGDGTSSSLDACDVIDQTWPPIIRKGLNVDVWKFKGWKRKNVCSSSIVKIKTNTFFILYVLPCARIHSEVSGKGVMADGTLLTDLSRMLI